MRILIVKTAPLGDLLSALPVLEYLHRAVPGVAIDWVVDQEFREALEGNPLLSSLYPVGIGEWRRLPSALRTLKEIGALKETLSQKNYDFAFDLEGTLGSGLIMRLSGAKDSIGFQRAEVRERSNMLFSMRRVPLRRQDCQVTNRCLRLVSVPFAKDYQGMELGCEITTSHQDELAAEALLATLSDGLVVLFHVGADWETKLWTQQGWVELGTQLLDSLPDASILLSWDDESEKALATGIAKGIRGARVLDRHSLKGLSALLKKVDLVVGGDSEVIRLAAALGTPTVSFYRATDGKQNGPRGEQHVIVQSPIHCSRCARVRCDKDQQCRGTIKVEAVWAGVQQQLNGGFRGE